MSYFCVSISYIDFLRQCVKFRGQATKNVNDVRKVSLRKCLCLLMCMSGFYMFLLFELGEVVPKTHTNMSGV